MKQRSNQKRSRWNIAAIALVLGALIYIVFLRSLLSRRNEVVSIKENIEETKTAIVSIQKVCIGSTQGTFHPTSNSLSNHKVPSWFQNAKFGIFLHWGAYSVPGWAPTIGEFGKTDYLSWVLNSAYAEWYMNTMRLPGSLTAKYHNETWGPNFKYEEFIPIFNKEVKKWNPNAWANLFKKIGARYVVLTTKHHDGFLLWPSEVENPYRNKEIKYAERDIVGELTESVRAKGIKMGLYYSGGFDWSFDFSIPEGRYHPSTPGGDYAKYADAHLRELIKKYEPDILWNDIDYPKNGELLDIIAEYYNSCPDGVVNNRFRIHGWEGDFLTPEYETFDKVSSKKWESNRGIGMSFGYNRNEKAEHMKSPKELIHMLIDIVSKNGNLLLDIGPMADGSISDLQMERVEALGSWLEINGEGIFDTSVFGVVQAETTSTGEQVRFTKHSNNKCIFIFLLTDAIKGQKFTFIVPMQIVKMEMLDKECGEVKWKNADAEYTIEVPCNVENAFTIKACSNGNYVY